MLTESSVVLFFKKNLLSEAPLVPNKLAESGLEWVVFFKTNLVAEASLASSGGCLSGVAFSAILDSLSRWRRKKADKKVRFKVQEQMVSGLGTGSLQTALNTHTPLASEEELLQVTQKMSASLSKGLQDGSLGKSLRYAEKTKRSQTRQGQLQSFYSLSEFPEEFNGEERRSLNPSSSDLGKFSVKQARTVTFSMSYKACYGEEMRIIGNVAGLGQWEPSRAVAMRWTDGHTWVATVSLDPSEVAADARVEYKYLLMSKGCVKVWEPGTNRALHQYGVGTAPLVCNDIWGSC